MKKVLLVLLVALLAVSCEKDPAGISKEEPDIKTAKITLSDDIIGRNQSILLILEYKTDNPNILISWYQGDEKLNDIPKSELSYEWIPKKAGDLTLKAVITDKNDIINTETTIKVVECELANAIIGDNAEKILRTKGKKDLVNNTLFYDESGRISKYYFTNNKLTKIIYENNINKVFQYEADFTFPITMFKSLFEEYNTKYGAPAEECFTELGTSKQDIILYGGRIYSGSMQVWSKYSTSNRLAEIYVEPTNYYKNGFRLTQQVELKK